MKKFWMKIGAFKRFLHKTADDWLALTGALLISYGSFRIFEPAGLIVLGGFFIAGAVIWSRGTGGSEP